MAVLVVLAIVCGIASRNVHVEKQDEYSLAAQQQAKEILSTRYDGRDLKKVSFRGMYVEKDAGEYIIDEVPALYERYQMLNSMQEYPWLPYNLRRKEMLSLKAVPDSLKSETEKEKLAWMSVFQHRRNPRPRDLETLRDSFLFAQKKYDAAVSTPVRVIYYEVRFRGEKGRYQAYFVSPVDTAKLKFLEMQEITLYNPQ